MEFRALGYTSEIFWHFVTAREGDALDTVLEKIIDKNGDDFQINLKKDPTSKHFHHRKLQLESSELQNEPPKTSMSIQIAEPRAVCFADIPFQHLDVHMARYRKGIGLGFRKEFLMNKYKSLIQPVHYYHSITEKLLEKISTYNSAESTATLYDYTKIPTLDQTPEETFNAIYLEREWRVMEDVSISFGDLAILALRSVSDFKKIETFKEISQFLISYGVSVINIESIFPKERK